MILAAVLMLAAGLSAAQESRASGAPVAGERLVLLGQNGPEFDACSSSGEVRGLRPGGDGFLSVRIAPSTTAREKDRIANGQSLHLCDDAGEWLGVVYLKPDDGPRDCGTGTPSAFVGAYRGPCRYGWVNRRFVVLLAG